MSINKVTPFLTSRQKILKRGVDICLSLLGLVLTWWLIILAWFLASIDTRSNGFFIQKRVGQSGKLFKVIKIKTMKPIDGITTAVTQIRDPRITRIGSFLRKTKLDELPQLLNVFLGQMSFVGPRPDVPGFADVLMGDERAILHIRPGITGPASLKYRDEEVLLASQQEPERYNQDIIWPDKVRINLDYIRTWSLKKDFRYMWKTIVK